MHIARRVNLAGTQASALSRMGTGKTIDIIKKGENAASICHNPRQLVYIQQRPNVVIADAS